MPAIHPRNVTFLELRDSVLCSECELISYNNTDHCLACGSRAVLSLSRVLGGSLREEPTARIVVEEPLAPVIEMPPRRSGSIVRPLLQPASAEEGGKFPLAVACPGTPRGETAAVSRAHFAMRVVVERAYRLSHSGGAAIAATRDGRMVCEARIGATAPPLGAEVRSGISAMSVRGGCTLRCDVASDDPRVDAASCRALGVNSMVAAPIGDADQVFGLITVLSPQPYAFDDRSVAVVQWLAGLLSVVFTSAPEPFFVQDSTTRCQMPS